MPRAAFLIIEAEPLEGVSIRKLVLETAKHNVLTAHSAAEGLEMLQRFPNVDAVVFHAELSDMSADEFIRRFEEKNSKVPLVLISPTPAVHSSSVRKVISSHDPQALMNLLEGIAGKGDQSW